MVRYSGLERSTTVYQYGQNVIWWQEEGTHPKVVPWSPILMISATLSFIRMAPIGTPCAHSSASETWILRMYSRWQAAWPSSRYQDGNRLAASCEPTAYQLVRDRTEGTGHQSLNRGRRCGLT